MLLQLTIKNYALIRHLELSPSGNLNVITGETGAGKSIMLGAIGLLTGNRADTKVLWDENEKCITEGVFDIKPYKLQPFFKEENLDYDDQTVIRREISPGGKSRAFINDTPVTLEVLKKLGSRLMDIHSQHETLELGRQAFQLKLIDAYAGNQALLENYEEAWREYTDKKAALQQLEAQANILRQEADYVNFQLDELVKANLEAGEQEDLEDESKVLQHAEEIKERLSAVLEILSRSEAATESTLKEARQYLQGISAYATKYEKLLERLQSVTAELSDLVGELDREENLVEFDPERAAVVTGRLDLIYRLQKKHRVNSVEELLAIQEELQQKAGLTANLDDELNRMREAFENSRAVLKKKAAELSKKRQAVFTPLCTEITRLLKELAIPEAVLKVDHRQTEPGPAGADAVDILFSANKGIAPRPLAQVASGGEFARLMFSVKYVMAEKTEMPTLVLDEIDTGVSGETAFKLGKLMRAMAARHQVLAITHLPQIAARAHTHYVVFKDNHAGKTVSGVKLLTEPERVEEIAKMIGGEKPSKVAVENARELLVG
ncbi:MAG: DNA repair protein RecN [Flammeovirgaceae bacterium]|nr:MAG: DNA repair protein RecN [Flammeovirgaceae bacterium]